MIDSVFHQVLSMSASASIIILVVLLARLALRKAPKRYAYALWAVVLFRLLCPSGIPVTIPVERAERAQAVLVNGEAAAQEAISKAAASRADMFCVIWLLGCLLMVLHAGHSWLKLRRELAGAVHLRDNIHLADHISSPFAMGLIHPKIYLPSALPESQYRYIIPHEQHHIRRFDHMIKPLFYVALCIHWFNPLVWAAFILFERDMEMSCDEAVIDSFDHQGRAEYAASLVTLATGRPIISSVPHAFGNGNTKGRVKNMLNWKKPKKLVRLAAAVVCVLTLAACAASPQLAQQVEDQTDYQVGTDAVSGIDLCTKEDCTDPSHPLEDFCTNVNCTDTTHPHYTVSAGLESTESCTIPNCTSSSHDHHRESTTPTHHSTHHD